MVRAIFDGRKTQTRRIVRGVEECPHGYDRVLKVTGPLFTTVPRKHCFALASGEEAMITSPYGAAGDHLWVRERWTPIATIKGPCSGNSCVAFFDGAQKYRDGAYYAASNHGGRFNPTRYKWKPSTHMPRWASRLTLEVKRVRVERLNDISDEDAKAEGLAVPRSNMGWGLDGDMYSGTAVGAYTVLWEKINGRGSWAANPLVWVVEFRRIGKPNARA